MNKNLSHTKNYFLGSVAIKATGFVSIPLFTNHLSVEEFGIISLYSSFLAFFTTLFSVGILGSIKRYYFELNNDFGSFLFSNILFLLIVDICVIFICMYYLSEISSAANVSESVVGYAVITAFFGVYIKLYLDLLQIKEQSINHNVFDFVRTVIILIFAVLLILLLENNKYLGKIYADLVGGVFVFTYAIYKLFPFLRLKFDFSHIKYSLSFGLPVLPSMFASFALTFADRLMINSYLDSKDVGLYSLAYNISIIAQIVVLAVSKSWQPIFYKYMNEKNYRGLDQIFYNNSKLVLAAALAVVLFSQELIVVLSNDSYLGTADVVLYLVIGFNFFFLYTIYGQYTSYAKKTYYNSIFMAISAVLNIVMNYYLIPLYGYKVSALTTLLGYFVMFLLFYFSARYVLKYRVVKLSTALGPHATYLLFIGLYVVIESLVIDYSYELVMKVLLFIAFTLLLFSSLLLRNLPLKCKAGD